MRSTTVPIPLLGVFAMTRAMLGAGIAFLLGDRMRGRSRRRAGLMLSAIGAASTIPLFLAMRHSR
jgi:hypothetical protein